MCVGIISLDNHFIYIRYSQVYNENYKVTEKE